MQFFLQDSVLALVNAFRQLHVLVIGDVMLDTYFEGSADRLCSEGPVPVVHKTSEARFPGGAANTAANLEALGAQVFLLGLIGADSAGMLLRSALEAQNISARWLVEDEQSATLHKLRILADGQYVVRFDEGDVFRSVRAQEALLEHLEELYHCCDLVVVSDYCYGVVGERLLERLSALYSAQPKVLLVDSKALQRFKHVTMSVVTPNYAEARLLVDGVSGHSGEPILSEVERIAQAILDRIPTEQVAITLGSQGVFLLDRTGKYGHLPAHPVAQANDVGAGDSFASAFALALGAGGTLEDAAQIGLDAASIAVSRRGTVVVQYQELLQHVSVRVYGSLAHASEGTSLEKTKRLSALLENERVLGRSIVFTNGVFDILHAGHVQFLRQAKALGDILVVGVNSDRGVRNAKGNGRPLTNERDRLSLVGALGMVDHVLLFDEETPEQIIRLLRPAIHVKGGDYSAEDLPEAEAVRDIGGRVVILPLAGSMNTGQVFDRIAEFVANQEAPMLNVPGEKQYD